MTNLLELQNETNIMLKGKKLQNTEKAKLKSVQTLDLQYCNLNNIEFLSQSKHLTHCSLQKNNISSLIPLLNVKNLVELNIYNNQLKAIDPIRECVSLKKLFVADNQITSLRPLVNLTNLEQLSFRNNPLKIEQLMYLIPLQKLWSIFPLCPKFQESQQIYDDFVNKLCSVLPASIKQIYLVDDKTQVLMPKIQNNEFHFTLFDFKLLVKEYCQNPIQNVIEFEDLQFECKMTKSGVISALQQLKNGIWLQNLYKTPKLMHKTKIWIGNNKKEHKLVRLGINNEFLKKMNKHGQILREMVKTSIMYVSMLEK